MRASLDEEMQYPSTNERTSWELANYKARRSSCSVSDTAPAVDVSIGINVHSCITKQVI